MKHEVQAAIIREGGRIVVLGRLKSGQRYAVNVWPDDGTGQIVAQLRDAGRFPVDLQVELEADAIAWYPTILAEWHEQHDQR